MPYASTLVGGTIFVVVMGVFLGQEFTQGFNTPDGGQDRDEKWALIYLEALPVFLVAVAAGFCRIGYGPLRSPRAIFAIGIAVVLVGLGVRQWGMQSLGRFHQARVTIQSDHRVVADGPYRFVRHPIYAGSALAFLGVGLMLGTWPGLLLVFFGTLAALLRRIRVEERTLATGLGDAYSDYAKGRARLFPGLW